MTLKIRVPGHRVLIRPEELEKKTDWGLVLARPGTAEKLEFMGTDRGTVVQVGPMAWKNFDFDKLGWSRWCEPGDQVIFARYSGKLIVHPETGEQFFLINDEDIQVVLDKEE